MIYLSGRSKMWKPYVGENRPARFFDEYFIPYHARVKHHRDERGARRICQMQKLKN